MYHRCLRGWGWTRGDVSNWNLINSVFLKSWVHFCFYSAAVSEFFQASCAPGAKSGTKLCELCKHDCSRSHSEPYYDYGGAFQSV